MRLRSSVSIMNGTIIQVTWQFPLQSPGFGGLSFCWTLIFQADVFPTDRMGLEAIWFRRMVLLPEIPPASQNNTSQYLSTACSCSLPPPSAATPAALGSVSPCCQDVKGRVWWGGWKEGCPHSRWQHCCQPLYFPPSHISSPSGRPEEEQSWTSLLLLG